MKTDFTPVDMNTRPRARTFMYFFKTAPTGYSLTVQPDVTGLRQSLKKKSMKFFPCYL